MKTEIVKFLNFNARQYDGITQLISQTKQRLFSLPGQDDVYDNDDVLKGHKNEEGLLTVKNRYSRILEKELMHWDIWELWLKQIRGIGPAIAAHLILLYYYKFVPVCKKCGGVLEKREAESKGKKINALFCVECGKKAQDGVLKYKIENRDFPTISKWWAFLGRHTVDGVMPRRKKGLASNWSTEGRTLGFLIAEQFNRQKDNHLYKKILLERKEKHARKHPEWTKGHIHNAACNETVKIFLAHFWVVARTLEGKSVSEPYAAAIMGHTNIVKPPFFEDSESLDEIHLKTANEV